ncbi:MAG TPA: ferritin [Baekduia sp.]|uniref:ferritin n=1 Tax=Baekduia sp. TaxID=2600305 RepID=UPI002B8BFE92|nr:ferritin [Baekduia sp.]HMJ35484.1 ferritin [Baekduia sp.]
MPSERFIDALNAQVAREFAAAHQYTAIGAYYADETYPQLSAFFYSQAEEEREHALKMVGYLQDTDSAVEFGSIAAPRADFEDHIAPIRLALEQEKSVTVSISELFEVARETRDYRSEQFLQWFLEEQTEEESSMSDLLAVAERTATVPMLLEEYLARETPGQHPAE